MNRSNIITFTTDFGIHDHYVGTMKGVALGINPDATLVDICHDVPSFNLLDGALTLAQAYKYFPEGTVHTVVVDPGVGSIRRAIVADTGRYVFVAPDNGVLSLIYRKEPEIEVRHITNDRYFLHPVSNTFHGRDIFAPVAAHVSAGVSCDKFGPVITDYERLRIPEPHSYTPNHLIGEVLKVDKFGNIVTNVTPDDLVQTFGAGVPFTASIAGRQISQIRSTYSGAEPRQVFMIFGSMGLLEIALNQGSAAAELQVTCGTRVDLRGKQ